MSQPKISVIVAVYNAEKTLDRLVQSLVCQTMTDFEVLLIDDGSTDNSASVCDNYACKDSRFKVFHKPNEGIGTTRQFGIDHAAGQYTIHADSDDWVEPDYLEKLLDKAVETDADMVICDIIEEKNGKSIINRQKPAVLDGPELPMAFFMLHGGPWNKLIRRSTYINAGIRYMDGLGYGEDKLFNMKLVLSGISISYLPLALYHYDLSANPNSAVHDYSMKTVLDREKFIGSMRSILPDRQFQDLLDIGNLEVVYMAVLSKSFTPEQFREKFAFLLRVKWKGYRNFGKPIKVIIWTSLHISYRLALFMGDIKKTVRRLRQRL